MKILDEKNGRWPRFFSTKRDTVKGHTKSPLFLLVKYFILNVSVFALSVNTRSYSAQRRPLYRRSTAPLAQ